jgi:hypothetical protein
MYPWKYITFKIRSDNQSGDRPVSSIFVIGGGENAGVEDTVGFGVAGRIGMLVISFTPDRKPTRDVKSIYYSTTSIKDFRK